TEVGDSQLTEQEIVHETTEKIIQIKSQIQAARDHQKDMPSPDPLPPLPIRHAPPISSWISMLKVSLWKGVIRFGKQEKLNPYYFGPFKILAKVGTVAYRLELPEQLIRVHSTFHVSNLTKCLSNETLVISLVDDPNQ
ncbi:hypothetical protein Tco_1469301, partial [Tanacetum coccineum]